MTEAVVNGARIHFERSGHGFPILFLHAGIADSRMWQPQADELSTDFDLIRPDMRGFGQSDLPAGEFALRDDAVKLLDHLGIERAHVVGCSVGGSVAIDVTIEHPNRVAKLVLSGSGVGGANFGEADQALFADVEAAEAAKDMNRLNEAEVRIWVDGPKRPAGTVTGAVRRLALDMNRQALSFDWDKTTNMRMDPPAFKRLEEISVPTLIIVGDEDVPHVITVAHVLHKSIRGSRLDVIRGAAHLPSIERPDEFSRLLRDFLTT